MLFRSKSKFSGRTETKDIEFETTVEAPPRTLTLADGGVVPYGYFMDSTGMPWSRLGTPNWRQAITWPCSPTTSGLSRRILSTLYLSDSFSLTILKI